MEVLLILFVLLNLLLAVLTLPMITGSLPPNGWYGFRTRATLSDPKIWYPVNRLSGKWLLGTSLVNAAAAVLFYFIPGLSVDAYALLCLLVLVIGMIFTMQRSFKLLKDLRRD